MSLSMTWVRLNGATPAGVAGRHSPPTWETLADGGTGSIELEFSMRGRVPNLLARGTLLEVMYGAQAVAAGRISEVDRTTGQVKALGLSVTDLLALDPSGNPTRDVAVAIATARPKGWQVTPQPGITGLAAGDSTEPVSLGQLLTDWGTERGLRVGVGGDRILYARADPSVARYMLAPGVGAFGESNESRVSHLLGRYDTGSAYASLIWPPSGYVHGEEVVDLTDRGALTVTQVATILGGALALGKGRPKWTNGVTVSRAALTRNGVPACLATVTAGALVRATGVPQDSRIGGFGLTEVIGKTRYTAGSKEIYLEPVNAVDTSYQDTVAAL